MEVRFIDRKKRKFNLLTCPLKINPKVK